MRPGFEVQKSTIMPVITIAKEKREIEGEEVEIEITKEILRYTPAEADRHGYLYPGKTVAQHNADNARLHPGKVVQYVYIDSEYCGICYKSDKLHEVVEKFSYFINKK